MGPYGGADITFISRYARLLRSFHWYSLTDRGVFFSYKFRHDDPKNDKEFDEFQTFTA